MPALCVGGMLCAVTAAETGTMDARHPFRTDSANDNLPWYRTKNLEFPPHHSAHGISGELVSADFVHRRGAFRATQTGEWMEFVLPPYGSIEYLNASADLRDVPLGTLFWFFLHQDEDGRFTRLATMQDRFTLDASHAVTYRLDEVKADEGKLLVTKHSMPGKQDDSGQEELVVDERTRFWKGDQPVKLAELKPGDELLFNLTGGAASDPGRCTEVWIGEGTHRLASEKQRQRFEAFTKARGLPGWIENTDGRTLTVTFFSGNVRDFTTAWSADFGKGKGGLKVCVANDELRTWNPPVDGEGATILDTESVPTDGYGCSGLRVVMQVSNMLEGFRKGRVVRVFGPGWKVQDQFYGESLMGYGYGRLQTPELMENPAKEYPEQFPFRTDFGNRELSWYQLKPGTAPPPFAAHVMTGEFVDTTADGRGGRFRVDGSSEVVSFSLIPGGKVRHLHADARLADLPTGTRCRFEMFEDEHGAFTQVWRVSDEFSHLQENANTGRVQAFDVKRGWMDVAWQIPEVKNYNGDMEQPQDIGRSRLRITPATRFWKGNDQVKVEALAPGDLVLMNLTGEQAKAPMRCTDVWIGKDTHQAVVDAQKKALPSPAKKG